MDTPFSRVIYFILYTNREKIDTDHMSDIYKNIRNCIITDVTMDGLLNENKTINDLTDAEIKRLADLMWEGVSSFKEILGFKKESFNIDSIIRATNSDSQYEKLIEEVDNEIKKSNIKI